MKDLAENAISITYFEETRVASKKQIQMSNNAM